MESNNLTINDINNLIETLKNDETVARAIMTQTKDMAMQTVREKLYTFLNERDLKSAYVIVLKDNVAEAEKLSEFVYRKVKEALVKEKSANAIEAPDLVTNEKKEQPTPAAEKQAPGEHLQPTSEHAPVWATASEKTQPETGVADRAQAAAGYTPTATSTTQTPTAPESRPHLSSFMLTIPNRFAERKNAGELTEQEARIEFKNFFTNALRTEQINENTPCQYVKLNGSAAPSQAYPGKTILDVCCDLAIAITFNQMQKIDSILNSPTHKQPPQNMNPAMEQQRVGPAGQYQGMNPMMGAQDVGQMGQTMVSNPTMDPSASIIDTSRVAASSVNDVSFGTANHEIDHVSSEPKLVNNDANFARQSGVSTGASTLYEHTVADFSSPNIFASQATPTANYSGNVYANIENKDTYKSTLSSATEIINKTTEIVNDPLARFRQMTDAQLIDLIENDAQHDTGLTPKEVDAIIEYLTNESPERDKNIKELNQRGLARIPMKEMDDD